MSRLRVAPAQGALGGVMEVPGDKSIGHRAVMLAGIARGRSVIRGLSAGEDNASTVKALRGMGVGIEVRGSDDVHVHAHEVRGRAGAGAGGRVVLVDGVGIGGLREPANGIDCGNSGTTMRLLAGLVAPARFVVQLDGDRSLRGRPMGRVVEPLRRMGARVEGSEGGTAGEVFAPLVVGPVTGVLRGIEHRSAVASAQVKSALMLAALAAQGRTRLVEPARSRDHTERMLRAMGAPVVVEQDGVTVDVEGWTARVLEPLDFRVPGDLSSAAFLLGAALLVRGSEVVIRGVGLNPTRTGVLDALVAMGADVVVTVERDEAGEPVGDVRARFGALRGARIDGELPVRAIDEIPLLAALAVHAHGETVIAGARELRVKESDRIAAMTAALRAMGADVEEREDGMVIGGGARLSGGRVDSRGDHRVAMASAVCALVAEGETVIDDAGPIATSFPGFVSSLRAMGAQVLEEL